MLTKHSSWKRSRDSLVKSHSCSEISWPCGYICSRSSCICQITGQGRQLNCKNDDSVVINTFLICLHWYFRQIGIYNKWKWTHFMIPGIVYKTKCCSLFFLLAVVLNYICDLLFLQRITWFKLTFPLKAISQLIS